MVLDEVDIPDELDMLDKVDIPDELDTLDEVEVAEILEDVVPVVAQVVAKLDAFLKLSDKVPLVTLNVVASAEEIVTVPLYRV